jgi:hypothetical protein
MGVHARLSGHGTLRDKAATHSQGERSGARSDTAGVGSVSDTFEYLASLSGHHPDPEVGGHLSERAHRLSDRLRNM